MEDYAVDRSNLVGKCLLRVTVIIDSKIPPDHISYDTYSIAIFKVEIYILRFKAICRQHTVKQRLIVRRLDIAVVQAMAMGIGKRKDY